MEHCLGGLGADAEESQAAISQITFGVPRPACAFGAKGPKGGYRSSSAPKSRCLFATGRDQLPDSISRIDGQPDAARWALSLCMAVPLIESISVRFQ
jgi:hypothetical protein